MKKFYILISLLMLGLTVQAVGSGKPSTQKSVTSSTTLSSAAQRKADSMYETLRKAYSQGNITADQVVEKALYHKVWSPVLAERCLRLVSDSNPQAMAELGLLYTNYKTAYLFPGKMNEGVALLEKSVQVGNKDAADYLGSYLNANKDNKRAVKYFNLATPYNNPSGLTVIGEMYEIGKGYKKNLPKAKECFRKAAMEGYAPAATKYGMSLQRKWYGDVDMPEAFKWIYIAGDLGNDAARSNLELPLRGERFGDDTSTALMRKALAMGGTWNKKFKTDLKTSPLYLEGFKTGLPKYEAAGEHGDDWTLFFLGSMSYNDEFLNRNDEFVIKCYAPIVSNKKLPKPAMALVYERLANIYREGRGVKADMAKAEKYDRLAAECGSLEAYKRVEKIPD